MKAAFHEIDITPPLGIAKIGWLKYIKASEIIDPIYAKIAIFDNAVSRVAFIQLDTLSVRWTFTNAVRLKIERRFGFPGANIMISASHNHAGPATSSIGAVRRDESYLETLEDKCVEGFGTALEKMEKATIAFKSAHCFDVGFNRRVVMRDGTVKTHGNLNTPDALRAEGPSDSELAILAAKSSNDKLMGLIVNFTCHPTHHGESEEISAGYPGALAYLLKSDDCPVSLFLNGAYGNIATSNNMTGANPTKESVAEKLFFSVKSMVEDLEYKSDFPVNSSSRSLSLPYRHVTQEEIAGTVHGAQRFIDSDIYDQAIPKIVERIKERKTQPIEVQVIQIGDVFFTGIPAEYFVEHGLRIKESTYPAHSLIVGGANGMIGYLPTQEAFIRGGYETTFGPPSKMAPETGDIIADAAIDLINKMNNSHS